MGRNKSVTVHSRAAQYKSQHFYVSDTNILMCKVCNVRINWEKNDTSEKHIKTATHVQMMAKFESECGSKRQLTLPTVLQQQKKAKIEKKEFIHDTVQMFMRANIPLQKIDDPAVRAYLNKYIPGSGDIPQATTLRSDYVPAVSESMTAEIKDAVQNKHIVVVADETTDLRGRCVFAELFRTVSASSSQKVYLASCSFLNTANGTTCCQAIVDTLSKFGINYGNVVGIVSDSARYMGKCFAALRTLLGDDLLHFQCWAHKINLVGDCFLKELEELNSLVAKMKTAFLFSRKIKNAYLAYLQEYCPDLPAVLFPIPVITRWNSWFTSVQYLSKYIDAILNFFKTCELNNNSSIATIIQMFETPSLAQQLKIQISFVSDVCVKIKSLITDLEGSTYPYAHKLLDELVTLQSSLQRYSEGHLPKVTMDILSKCTTVTQKETVKSQLMTCMRRCVHTLSNHMSSGVTNIFYQDVNYLFNPAIAGQKLQVDLRNLEQRRKRLPLMAKLDPDTFIDGYTYFHRQLLSSLKEEGELDIIQLLLSVKLKYHEFAEAALKCVWSPVNSVDAERFFSRYNVIVTDRRTNMTEESVETCAMLSFNSVS